MAGLAPALYEGEDFELLFTVDAARCEAFDAAWRSRFDVPCTAIGTVIDQPAGAVMLDDGTGRPRRLDDAGYEHFRA